jgi:hypothetical protein
VILVCKETSFLRVVFLNPDSLSINKIESTNYMLATIQIKGIGLTADWIYMLFSKSITDKAVSLTRISYDWNEPNT